MSPALQDRYEALLAERYAPVPPPMERYPDGPTARAMREAAVEEAAQQDEERAT